MSLWMGCRVRTSATQRFCRRILSPERHDSTHHGPEFAPVGDRLTTHPRTPPHIMGRVPGVVQPGLGKEHSPARLCSGNKISEERGRACARRGIAVELQRRMPLRQRQTAVACVAFSKATGAHGGRGDGRSATLFGGDWTDLGIAVASSDGSFLSSRRRTRLRNRPMMLAI